MSFSLTIVFLASFATLLVSVGRWIEFSGTVTRAGMLKVLEHERTVYCTTCSHTFTQRTCLEDYHAFPRITACPNTEGKPCRGKLFRSVEGSNRYRDYQDIKVQEQVKNLGFGCMPRSLIVVLEEDLVDSCKVRRRVCLLHAGAAAYD